MTDQHKTRQEKAGKSSIRKVSPIERKRRASNAFMIRVGILLTLMGGTAYAAWFAPWAKPIRTVKYETGKPLGTRP